MPPKAKNRKIGFFLLFLSGLFWAAIFALPFLEIENKWLIGALLYGTSYLFFFGSAGFLGKELKAMSFWKKFRRSSES